MLQNRTILHGDVLEKLKEIPDNSIDCEISSPPYWGLRDYKVGGQWGLEPDFHDYLKLMQKFMNEMKRVLKPTGTCWINLGDTYSGGYAHSDWDGADEEFDKKRQKDGKFQSILKNQIKAKSRYGIPERFYADCIDNGWIARNHIPWIKENSMPSSVKDRFTNKWESVFFFAKEGRYYFNLDAVRVKPKTETKPFNVRIRDAKKGLGTAKLGDSEKAWKMSEEEDLTHNEKGERIKEKYEDEPSSNVARLHREREGNPNHQPKGRSNFGIGKEITKHLQERLLKQDSTLGADGKPKMNYKGFNDRWKNRKHQEQTIARKHTGVFDMDTGELLNNPNGKNPGDIFEEEKWKKHYDENGLCLGCGEHWSKHTVSERAKGSMSEVIKRTESICWCNPLGKNPGDVLRINPRPFPEAHFATFPVDLPLFILKCACPPDGIVLDPFFGAGTVGVAAEMLGRNWIGIELSEEYIKIARQRLEPYNIVRLDNFK